MTIKTALFSIIFVVVILFISVFYPIIYQVFANVNQPVNKPQNIMIAAHRGASNQAPENTLVAIQKALSGGAKMIEFDIHLTKDGHIIVMHDAQLDRTTDGTGNVADYTLQELKKLDAGSWFSSNYRGEKIPTLLEVLTLIDGKAVCLIEIKWDKNGTYQGITKKLLKDIEDQNAQDWVIIQSFESSYLANIHQLNTSIELGKLLIGSWQFPFPFYFDHQFHWGQYTPPTYIKWVIFYAKRSTPAFIAHLKSYGVKVGVFTPNTEEDIFKQAAMGVDLIITNKADLAEKIINN